MKIVWKWENNPTDQQLTAAHDAIVDYVIGKRQWPANETGFEHITNTVEGKERTWAEFFMRFPKVGEWNIVFTFPGILKGEEVGLGYEEYPSGITDGFNVLETPPHFNGHTVIVRECLRLAKKHCPTLRLEEELVSEIVL